jgi:phosphatidylglycerol:prolipoprotein diacylglycerol transferase
MAVAFALGWWLSMRRASRARFPGWAVLELTEVVLVSSLVGARALYVIEHWADYAAEPLRVLAVWEGGLVFFGGALFGTVGAILWTRRRRLPVLATCDLLAPAVAFGEAIGRVGCFLNGCCFGVPTGRPWGVRFPAGSFAAAELGSVPVHPTQIYQALWAVGVGLLLIGLGMKRRPGTIFFAMVLGLSAGRALIDTFRFYDAGGLLHLGGQEIPVSQVTALLLAVAAGGGLVVLRRRGEGAPAKRSRGRR